MPSLVQIIKSDTQLTSLLLSNKNVVIDFHAVWCGPCKATAPVFEKLADSLTSPGQMIFVKCDVDECVEVARKYQITAMPTFLVFKDGAEIKRVQGANIPVLSSVIKDLIEEAKGSGSGMFAAGASSSSGSTEQKGWWGASLPKGYWDVSEEIELVGLDILNANTECGDARALFADTKPSEDKTNTKDYVESDTDEQLMIFIPFRSTIKLHTIHLTSLPQATDDDEEVGRPTKLKLYANRANIVGFDEADGLPATQEIELSKDSWDAKTGTAVISTRFVKFQSVSSLTIFVEEGDEGCEKTRIDRIRLVGEAGEKRDMGKLEKVKDGHE